MLKRYLNAVAAVLGALFLLSAPVVVTEATADDIATGAAFTAAVVVVASACRIAANLMD
ncbi:MAG: hypothetical protein II264_04540 [Ruminococcus sp.]|nr:hypothetical protein [Ruminococcus sp.]